MSQTPAGATKSEINQAAARLFSASETSTPVEPVRDLLGDDLDAAYLVQEVNIKQLESSENPRVGRKVGLTSDAVQKQLGVDQPDFGVLLASMDVSELDEVPSSLLLQPKVEAEIAFIMAKDVLEPTRENVVDAVGEVAAALEIVDSRVRDWDITIVDTVADNASSGLFVLSKERKQLSEIDPIAVQMSMTRNGEVASSGTGVDCLGDPVNALVWVAETAHRLGMPLRAGEVVLSGALGPMVLFDPGTTVKAELSGLGSVTATASKE